MFSSKNQEWDTFIETYMTKMGIPGLSIAVVTNDDCLYHSAFGYRDIEQELPMTTNTIFGIGSISKTFTSLACLKLVEAGKLDLEKPVNEYIDILPSKFNDPICVKHLLSHTSGFGELSLIVGYIFQQLGVSFPEVIMDSVEYINKRISEAKSEIICRPGEKFIYQNEMYLILAQIIEKQCGISFEDYVSKMIFEPFGLTDTSYNLSDNSDIIKGALGNGQSIKPFIEKISSGCGGIFSNTNDLIKYIRAFNSNNLVTSEQKKVLFGKRITSESDTNKGYGLGWFVLEDFLGQKVVYHGGDLLYSGGLLVLVPEKCIGIAIGINTGPTGSLFDIVKKILTDLLEIEETQQILGAEPQKVKNLVGKYQTFMGLFNAEISFNENVVVLSVYYPGLKEPSRIPLYLIDSKNFVFRSAKIPSNASESVQFIFDTNIGFLYNGYYFHKITD